MDRDGSDFFSMESGSAAIEPAVIGPDGRKLTLAALPPADSRWVPRRKAEVVVAVRGGLLTLGQACDRYALTIEEFHSWQQAVDKFGLPGLRATHAQQYRVPVR
jgi:Protein of unknown function (DUF1153)